MSTATFHRQRILQERRASKWPWVCSLVIGFLVTSVSTPARAQDVKEIERRIRACEQEAELLVSGEIHPAEQEIQKLTGITHLWVPLPEGGFLLPREDLAVFVSDAAPDA